MNFVIYINLWRYCPCFTSVTALQIKIRAIYTSETAFPLGRKFPSRKEISFQKEIWAFGKELGNLLSLCREIAGARDILQKFENLKKTTRVEFQLMILHF